MRQLRGKSNAAAACISAVGHHVRHDHFKRINDEQGTRPATMAAAMSWAAYSARSGQQETGVADGARNYDGAAGGDFNAGLFVRK